MNNYFNFDELSDKLIKSYSDKEYIEELDKQVAYQVQKWYNEHYSDYTVCKVKYFAATSFVKERFDYFLDKHKLIGDHLFEAILISSINYNLIERRVSYRGSRHSLGIFLDSKYFWYCEACLHKDTYDIGGSYCPNCGASFYLKYDIEAIDIMKAITYIDNKNNPEYNTITWCTGSIINNLLMNNCMCSVYDPKAFKTDITIIPQKGLFKKKKYMCNHCNHEIKEAYNYCPYCGYQIVKSNQ